MIRENTEEAKWSNFEEGWRQRGAEGNDCYSVIMTCVRRGGELKRAGAVQYLNRSLSNLSSSVNCYGDAKLESPFFGPAAFHLKSARAKY